MSCSRTEKVLSGQSGALGWKVREVSWSCSEREQEIGARWWTTPFAVVKAPNVSRKWTSEIQESSKWTPSCQTQGHNWELKRGNSFWETRESISQSTQPRDLSFFGCKIKQDPNSPTSTQGWPPSFVGPKMQTCSPLCINYQEFQNDDSRTLNQAQDSSKYGALCDCVGHMPMKLGLLRCFVLRGTFRCFVLRGTFTNRVSVSETQTSWSLMSPDWLNSTSKGQAAFSTVYTMQVPDTWVPSKWKGLFSLIILKIYTEDDNSSHAQQYVAGENFKLPSVVLSIILSPFYKSESSIRLVFAKQGEDRCQGNWGKSTIVLQNKIK